MARKAEFPETGELVVCTIHNVKNFGAFATLDEYGGKEGFIHVRDVATGWVKYIRDHVREGQKTVCKVLSVDSDRGHIDLSLKAVNDHQRREKIQEWKNEKKAEKLLEIVGSKMGKSLDQAFDVIGEGLLKEFGTLYGAFEEAAVNISALKEIVPDKKWLNAVAEVASENIQLPSVQIEGDLEITCASPDGIDAIKSALSEGLHNDAETDVTIAYLGAPHYRVVVKAADYKTAEEEMKRAVARVETSIEKHGGAASFRRKEEK